MPVLIPSSKDASRYCRNCGYCLNELEGRTCPECAARFDPADASTFVHHPRASIARHAIGVAVTALVGLTLVGILILYPDLFGLLLILPMLVGVWIALLGWRRAGWRLWESALLVCPLHTWVVLAIVLSNGKSLSNQFVELLLVAWVAPLAVLGRVVLGRDRSPLIVALGILVLEVLATLAVFILIPPLPE